ncbi:MAG: nuclear transport factor 2 family protein, partial [Actinomycetota bacterium]|nr:nuclear transport factor 2 family protein [Actinomycetota bacterium]
MAEADIPAEAPAEALAKTPAKKPAKPRRSARVKAVEEVGRSYFEAIDARDADAVASHFHPDGIDDIVALGVFRGPDAVRAFFREMFAAMPDATMKIERIVADHEVAAVQWR